MGWACTAQVEGNGVNAPVNLLMLREGQHDTH